MNKTLREFIVLKRREDIIWYQVFIESLSMDIA